MGPRKGIRTKACNSADKSTNGLLDKMNQPRLIDDLGEVDKKHNSHKQKSMRVGASKEKDKHDGIGAGAEPPTLTKTVSVQPNSKDCVCIPCVKPKSFIDLPREIRDMIYNELVRPDAVRYYDCTPWPNALGCTKVLGLSREIHAEAIKVFELIVPTLNLHGRRRRVFRNMLAHGTPGMFKSFSTHTADYIPQLMTELSFLRLRKVDIALRYPAKRTSYQPGGQEKMAGLGQEILQLHEAVRKSKSLVQLHFKIQTGAYERIGGDDGLDSETECKPIVSEDNSELMEMLIPVIVTASKQGFTLTAETNREFWVPKIYEPCERYLRAQDYNDPVVTFINNAAIARLANCSSPPPPTLPHTVLVKPEADPETANHGIVKTSNRILYPPSQNTPYSLLPECRKCYATFRDQSNLTTHLTIQHPNHRVAFVKKAYNELNKTHATTVKCKNKCRTCGMSFDKLASFEQHCEKYKHTRTREQGIVGRWKQDNRWYKCSVPGQR